jgi:protein-tyrosine kinase
MSIIETALEKGRIAEKQRRPVRVGGDVRADAYSRRAETIAADARIAPLAVTVDSATCRDRRIFLGNSGDADESAVAAYRMLRTRLLHRAHANKWSTIAVTSAGPNDGKTLTAINLALSMSREKTREIVLFDMDMRNPSVCRTLGVHPPYELREYLEHGGNVRQLFFTVGSDNLLIAGSSSPTEHASELLSSARFDDLIGAVRQGTVDSVMLFDLPPVLLTDDALVVAPKVDAVLLVVSEGVTSRADFSKALDVLSEFKIAGIVLNRAAETAPGYEYGYYPAKE